MSKTTRKGILALATAVATIALIVASAEPAGASTVFRARDTPIPVGNAPVAIAIDATRHIAWVVNHGSASVTAIDTGTSDVLDTVAVGASPKALAIDRTTGTVYVGSYADGSVTVIDEATRTVTTTIASVSSSIDAMAIDPAAHTLWVGDEQGEEIARVDTSNNTVLAGTTHVGQFPTAMSIDTVHHRLYVALGGSGVDGFGLAGTNAVVIVSTLTGHSLGTVTGVGDDPRAILVDPATQYVYVGRVGSTGLVVISGASHKKLIGVHVPFEVVALARDSSNGRIFAVGAGSRMAYVAGADRRVIFTTTLEGNPVPTGIAVNGGSHGLWVTTFSSDADPGTVAIYDRVVSPEFLSGTPPSGRRGVPYSFHFRAYAQPGPGFFTSPGLPPGLHLNHTTGVLSGTPTTVGTFHFRIILSNSITVDLERHFTIVIGR